MPRVSEVLDYFAEPYLVEWKLRVGKAKAQEISRQALDIGSEVDQLVQDHINNGEFALPKDGPAQNCMHGWMKFTKDFPEVLRSMRKYKENMQRELVLGDLVGHPDFILGDEVCDLKTSKSVSKSHWMQTAQYAKMWASNSHKLKESPFFKIHKISILRLDKNDPGVYEYKVLEEPFITFWQGKFQARFEAFKEDGEFKEMMRKKLEEERLA